MEQIIGYLITGIFSLLGSALMLKKSDHEKEISNTRLHQSLLDRIENLEKKTNQIDEMLEKINKIEMICVELKTKLEIEGGTKRS